MSNGKMVDPPGERADVALVPNPLAGPLRGRVQCDDGRRPLVERSRAFDTGGRLPDPG